MRRCIISQVIHSTEMNAYVESSRRSAATWWNQTLHMRAAENVQNTEMQKDGRKKTEKGVTREKEKKKKEAKEEMFWRVTIREKKEKKH